MPFFFTFTSVTRTSDVAQDTFRFDEIRGARQGREARTTGRFDDGGTHAKSNAWRETIIHRTVYYLTVFEYFCRVLPRDGRVENIGPVNREW